MQNDDNFNIFMGGLVLLGILFLLAYILPLNIYINNNLDRNDLSSWEEVTTGYYSKCTDIYGNDHYYLDNTPIELSEWGVIRAVNGETVHIPNLLVGNRYTIYVKHFWWPSFVYYTIVSEDKDQSNLCK